MVSAERPRAPRADESMSLLVDMSQAALDPSYAEAAAHTPTAGRGVRTVAVLLLVGLGTGVVAAQVRRHADLVGATRGRLLADVRAGTTATDALDRQASLLRSAVTRARQDALGTDTQGREAGRALAALELASGGVAVHGPGLEVVLDDAGSATASGQSDGRIYDRDLQEVTNALWAAGAEAIAVNDQRVTAQTAIRSAGEAILVDLRPLTPPYVVKAIGDVDVMESRFVDGPTARKFQTWTSLYGLGFDVRRVRDLTLSAAGAPDVRLTRPGGAP